MGVLKTSPIPKGTVWPWNAMLVPPEGWRFLPHYARVMRWQDMPIVATRDHDTPPQLTGSQLKTVLSVPDKQAQYGFR